MLVVGVDGREFEATPYSVSYPNDLLNGIIVDSEEQYGFLSDHVESHRDIMEQIGYEEEVEHFDLSDCVIDMNTAPHSMIVARVAALMIETAESWIEEYQ